MKKTVLGIYIAMIIIGVLGLFYYMSQSAKPAVKSGGVARETIIVAVAKRDLDANSILQTSDYEIKTIAVPVGGTEKQFNLSQTKITNWALNNAVTAKSYISPSMLVEPGSDTYLSMFLRPGNVLYTFEIETTDNYLLTNLKPGQEMDVYLSYSLKKNNKGNNEIVSPAHSISESRLKPLLMNKRVLAMRQADTSGKNSAGNRNKKSMLIAELNDQEVKLLKSLEGKVKIILFPSSQPSQQFVSDEKQNHHGVSERSGSDAAWPVSDEPIFKFSSSPVEINELRG
ncbi:hypothetical protein GJV11_20545 [Enterobacteriaceae bacterium RIT693]|nr:hypothetical protein [Enterobacteriaceae bacterium RIT693]